MYNLEKRSECMAELKNNAKEAAKKIKLLAFDVDGVMTDGSITYDENGVEYKTFNVKDGHALVRMAESGFITAIITARNNGTVQHRAENLNITEICQGQKYKLPVLKEIMKKYHHSFRVMEYSKQIAISLNLNDISLRLDDNFDIIISKSVKSFSL